MNCWHCNTELRWVGDHDVDELTDNRYTILSCLECPECKSWVEVYYPNLEHEDHKQKGVDMEALLVLGALAYGMHHINKQDEPEATVQGEVIFNEGIEEIDWSKAGNFRTVSTENNVQWVMITEG